MTVGARVAIPALTATKCSLAESTSSSSAARRHPRLLRNRRSPALVTVEAADHAAAMALLPAYLRARTDAVEVNAIPIP